MKKIALFVEGQTEQLFVRKLIEELAGRHNLAIDIVRGLGGQKFPRSFTTIHASTPAGARFYVLICDSTGENSVLTDIIDQYPTLVAQGGFEKILGIRDVYPQPLSRVPAIRQSIAPFIPQGKLRVEMVLAIAEIEAWFLAEETHFNRIDPALTSSAIESALGNPITSMDVEQIPWPSDTLRRIYQLVGLTYQKDHKRVQRTIDSLDFAQIYLNVTGRVSALQKLCSELDNFLS